LTQEIREKTPSFFADFGERQAVSSIPDILAEISNTADLIPEYRFMFPLFEIGDALSSV
jgi:hypothetical protein